ncbi:UPF0132 membrane protein [Porphyridium purpureum]|uniref:UPF0132 membrane protein n=1 Tax=Porphyridium purpureum TaxID=35688 RepID=A0A5J4YU98_PORPP|nr:UPF0132 membrane protein [Porphyridium purpureum]|eukprot:POR7162..scf227_4
MPDYKTIGEDAKEALGNTRDQVLYDKSTRTGVPIHVAAVLCYLFTWVGGIVVLALEHRNAYLKFHACQSIAFFLLVSALGALIGFFRGMLFGLAGWLSIVLGVISLLAWLGLMWKAFTGADTGEKYKVPFLGNLVEDHI